MATAYTIRYGNENAGGGPPGSVLFSVSRGDELGLPISLGDGIAMPDITDRSTIDVGGGFIAEVGVDVGITDSGSAVIASSDDEVSSVI